MNERDLIRILVRLHPVLSPATAVRMTDVPDIVYPPEKIPTRSDPDLENCYLVAWVDYLLALLTCPQPITQACVDEKYDDYCIAVVTCETLHPPSSE